MNDEGRSSRRCKAIVLSTALSLLPLTNLCIGYGSTRHALLCEEPRKGSDIAQRIVNEYPSLPASFRFIIYGNYLAAQQYLSSNVKR